MSARPLLLFACAAVALAAPGGAQDIGEGEALYARGAYAEALRVAEEGLLAEPDEVYWHELLVHSLLRTGNYGRARAIAEAAADQFSRDVPLALLAHDTLLRAGDPEAARRMLVEVLDRERPWSRTNDARVQTVRGRARLHLGEDARDVMKAFYEPARLEDPVAIEPLVAIAELALSKHDDQLAAQTLGAALELEPDRALLHVLLARALAGGDGAGATAALSRALELNPNHPEALLLAADHRIAGEAYDEAEELLGRLLASDGNRWEAWAYRAVLAHLAGDFDGERGARERALSLWTTNPGVDHLIGRELSERYRFSEGAAAQRRALAFDEDFRPARFQLALDLLRLGSAEEEEKGWDLADDALDEDPFNVVAYNLMVLHDVMEAYETLERDGLVVRMLPGEAAVYGERVLDLLTETKKTFADRYRVTLAPRLVVEIFGEQKDFAIRTFGLPGGHGFLGVCFGDVVTMKSPSAPGSGGGSASWEATLFHEFLHVVTLEKTNNRIPRWLSEGISVWEERRRRPAWGQSMKPAYRSLILADAAFPVSQLSRAFSEAQDNVGIQFAYYQSSLVVEYVVESKGFEALLAVLDDLAGGDPIDRALAANVAPMDELDAGFEAYLRERAAGWVAKATFEPYLAENLDELLEVLDDAPRNYGALHECARRLVEEKRAVEALPLLERLLELDPTSARALETLAEALMQTGDTEAELEARLRWAQAETSAWPGRERLMRLLAERGDWSGLHDAARDALAIRPMNAEVQRRLAQAAEELGRFDVALDARRAELALGPVDPARVHYQVAQAAVQLGDVETARREVLSALEEAPRFRAAHALLLEIVEGPPPDEEGTR